MTSSASRGQSRTVIARTQLIKKDVFLNQSGRWSVTLRCCCTPPGTGTAVRIHSLPHRERHGYPWKTRFSMDHSGYGISEFESYMPSQISVFAELVVSPAAARAALNVVSAKRS